MIEHQYDDWGSMLKKPTVAVARSLRCVHNGLIDCLDGNNIAERGIEVG
jgi:hypothetical protein